MGTATADADEQIDTTEGPILLFDGVCNLCNGFVQFVLRHEAGERFRFASLQSDVATEILEGYDPDAADLDSVVLVEDGQCYTRSTAALKVARHLEPPYRLGRFFIYAPRILRDAVYRLVATSRYRVFGKKDRCMVPSEDTRDRFLDA